MKLGVISDTHDNLPAIEAAIGYFRRAGVETIIHAGDYVAPFALKMLLQAGLPIIGVFGNCDGERGGLAKLLPDIAEGPRRLDLGGKKITLVHNSANLAYADFEAADIVITGHTHQPKIEQVEGRLVVNPGECGGWVTGRGTVAIVDTDTMTADVEDVWIQARTTP
jgi:uncharacterized protein